MFFKEKHPELFDAGSYDACGSIQYVEFDSIVLNCSNIGQTAIDLTVVDAYGNMNSCEANLNLSNNHLTLFDKTLTNLRNIKILNLSHNFIEFLPKDFGKMRQLIELDLSNNRLTEFPNDRIDVLASLTKLILKNNLINKIILQAS